MRILTITPVLLSSLALAGCSLLGLGEDDGGGSSVEENIAHYEQVRLDLEANREAILPGFGVDDISAVDNYLTWLDITQGWEAQLHIRHYPEASDIIAAVTVGDEMTTPFYRLDDKYAMTALTGSNAIYKIIDLQTGELADEVTHKKPQSASYDTYGIRGDQAYLVVEDEGKMIYEWNVGTGSPVAIGAIDDTSANLGAWIDFTLVEFGGSRKLLALGSYGTYTIDLDSMVATEVPLPITPLEIGITDLGIAAIDGSDLWFVGWGDTEARAIHEELKSSSYTFNSTLDNVHWVGSGTANIDVSMNGELIYYNSVGGIFTYGVNSGTIEPVLLDNAGYEQDMVTVKYTGITVTQDAMYVVGLESSNGLLGPDQKEVYRVQL